MINRNDESLAFDRRLGKRIREYRRQLRLSQDDVVEAASFYGLDLPRESLARIEKGRRPAYPIELVVLARVVNLDLFTLLPPSIKKQ